MGTGKISDDEISALVEKNFDFRLGRDRQTIRLEKAAFVVVWWILLQTRSVWSFRADRHRLAMGGD